MLSRFSLNGLVNNRVNNILGAGQLFTTGTVYYVNSTLGSDGNKGTDPAFPLATIGAAQTAATASRGDVVVIMPGYAETRTTVLTLSKAGVTYIGLGTGSLKATITINAAVDAISITGANVTISGFHFAAPETDAATAMVNVAAANAGIYNMTGIGSKTAKNFVDCITIASGADDLTIDGLEIYNTSVAVNSFINIEAAVARLKLFNAFMFGDCVTAGVIDAAVVATQLHFKNVTIGTIGSTIPAVTLDGNPTGLIENCYFAGTHTTLATNFNPGNLLRLSQVYVSEETDASKQGALIPAVDAD